MKINTIILNRGCKFLCLLLLTASFSAFSNTKNAYSTRILATVGNNIITDTDIESFSQMLCVLNEKQMRQSKINCKSPEMQQMAVMGLVEENVKNSYFQQLKVEEKTLLQGFDGYKKQMLKNINHSKIEDKEMFDWYLKTEFKWLIVVQSQTTGEKITDEDIEEISKTSKIPNNKQNSEKLKNLAFAKKAEKKSQELINEMKKYTLIEFK